MPDDGSYIRRPEFDNLRADVWRAIADAQRHFSEAMADRNRRTHDALALRDKKIEALEQRTEELNRQMNRWMGGLAVLMVLVTVIVGPFITLVLINNIGNTTGVIHK